MVRRSRGAASGLFRQVALLAVAVLSAVALLLVAQRHLAAFGAGGLGRAVEAAGRGQSLLDEQLESIQGSGADEMSDKATSRKENGQDDKKSSDENTKGGRQGDEVASSDDTKSRKEKESSTEENKGGKHSDEVPRGCTNCCRHNGQPVPCFDHGPNGGELTACAARFAPGPGRGAGRFAFVLRPNADRSQHIAPYLQSLRSVIDGLESQGLGTYDILLLSSLGSGSSEMSGLRLVEAPWGVPPKMLYGGGGNWCGPADLVALHAFALEEYDAVAVLDAGLEVGHQSIAVALRCAATGRLLYTGGSERGADTLPWSMAFLVLRPDRRLLQAAERFASLAPFTREHGWANTGFAGRGNYYDSAECGPGFFHTLFTTWTQPGLARQSMEREGVPLPAASTEDGTFQVAQLDLCVWNYQHSWACHQDFDCSRVVGHFCPNDRGSDPKECMKRTEPRRCTDGENPQDCSKWALPGAASVRKASARVSTEPGCHDCCYRGKPCLDHSDELDECSAQGPKAGRFALVFRVGIKGMPALPPHLSATRAAAARAAEATGSRVELVLLVPPDHEDVGTLEGIVADNEMRVVEVPWATPPGLSEKLVHGSTCLQYELTFLHAFNLTEYDAFVVLGHSLEVSGDLLPALRCAATGKLLYTAGGYGEPWGSGLFMARPDERVLRAAEAFAAEATYTAKDGWSGMGFAYKTGEYAGSACSAGFFHTLFTMWDTPGPPRSAMLSAGATFGIDLLDMCVWSYQHSGGCKSGFDCNRVVVHQSPNERGSDAGECLKRSRPHEATDVTGRCSNGYGHVPCFDVEACAARFSGAGRFALVTSLYDNLIFPFLQYVQSFRDFTRNVSGTVDFLLVMNRTQAKRLLPAHKNVLAQSKIAVVEVDWTFPPEMLDQSNVGSEWGDCAQSLIRIHAFGLEGYDAIVYYPVTAEAHGSLVPLFHCIATSPDLVLTTLGHGGDPKVEVFALRPRRELVDVARKVLSTSKYSNARGWANCGHAPSGGHFPFAECSSAFLYTFLHKRKCDAVKHAYEELQIAMPRAAQVDFCRWYYQGEADVCRKFPCLDVRGHGYPFEAADPSRPWSCPKRDAPRWRPRPHVTERSLCNDGLVYTPCFGIKDLEACAARGPDRGRYAFVLSNHGDEPPRTPHIHSMWRQTLAYLPNVIDIVMLFEQAEFERVKEQPKFNKFHELVKKYDIKVVRTPWKLPPGLRYTGQYTDWWYGLQDFIRLNAFNLVDYDAVAYYDNDMQLMGNLLPMLKCAATGKFLSTSGGVGEPLNCGFFALRPSKVVFEAALIFANTADYDPYSGWAEGSFRPSMGEFPGADSGQGFLHTLFYKIDNPIVQQAWEAAGASFPDDVHSEMLDMCVWNYQGDRGCRKEFRCEHIIVHHKPNDGEPGHCPKTPSLDIADNVSTFVPPHLPPDYWSATAMTTSHSRSERRTKKKAAATTARPAGRCRERRAAAAGPPLRRGPPPERQLCRDCCSDGDSKAPCLVDLGSCAAASNGSSQTCRKFALVLALLEDNSFPFLPNLASLSAAAAVIEEQGHQADVVLLVTKKFAKRLDGDHRNVLKTHAVKLKEVGWAHPVFFKASTKPPGCEPQHLLKLHALNLAEYDAVAYFDVNVEVQGDLLPMLQCAAAGTLLTTAGADEPVSFSFFAAKPDERVFQAYLLFAQNATFSQKDGWARAGFAPKEGNFVGAACGHGLLHALFYKSRRCPTADWALRSSGADAVIRRAAQLDKCVWNYQRMTDCDAFDCMLVRAHQAPDRLGSSHRECQKAWTRRRRSHVANRTWRGDAGCADCCNDGEESVPCLPEAELEACAAAGPAAGRFAFVLCFTGRHTGSVSSFLPYIDAMRQQADSPETHTVDIVLIMTFEDAANLAPKLMSVLKEYRVRLVEVEWAVPPDMKFHPKGWWCGVQDMIRIHAFGLEEYDAVAFYDADVALQGNVLPVLRCAATGRFLATSGGVGEPLNVGFFALRPNRSILEAARNFARNAKYSKLSGWAKSAFLPSHGEYPGSECGQGFWHALFYKIERNKVVAQAWIDAGVVSGGPVVDQLDLCIWNYQGSGRCAENFDCRRVRAHHKPVKSMEGARPNECQKRLQRG